MRLSDLRRCLWSRFLLLLLDRFFRWRRSRLLALLSLSLLSLRLLLSSLLLSDAELELLSESCLRFFFDDLPCQTPQTRGASQPAMRVSCGVESQPIPTMDNFLFLPSHG